MRNAKTRRGNKILAAAVGAAGVMMVGGMQQSSHAQDTTTTAWKGTASTAGWGTGANWNGNVIANATASALFGSLYTGAQSPTLTDTTARGGQGIWLATGLTKDVTITATGTGTVRILTITGTATLNGISNAGILLDDSANHNLTINDGSLNVLRTVLSNDTGFYVNNAGTLTFDGGGTRRVDLAAKTLTVGGTGASGSIVFDAYITNTNPLSNIIVDTAGSVSFNASNNDYGGTTTIRKGTLKLDADGNIPGTSLVLGNSTNSSITGTLDVTAKGSFSRSNVSGNGALNIGSGKSITLTGTLQPGFSLGQVDVDGSLALGTTTNMEVAATNAADLVNVSESITYSGALVITGNSGFNIAGQAGSYNLFDFTGADNGKFDTVTVGGTGLTFTTTSNKWTGSSGSAQYTFNEGTGVLSVVVPEPGSAAALLAAGALMAIRRRKRD